MWKLKVEGTDWCALAAFVLLVAAISFLAGDHHGTVVEHDANKQEAIEHGAASYVCDPKTGETTFRWKEQK